MINWLGQSRSNPFSTLKKKRHSLHASPHVVSPSPWLGVNPFFARDTFDQILRLKSLVQWAHPLLWVYRSHGWGLHQQLHLPSSDSPRVDHYSPWVAFFPIVSMQAATKLLHLNRLNLGSFESLINSFKKTKPCPSNLLKFECFSMTCCCVHYVIALSLSSQFGSRSKVKR